MEHLSPLELLGLGAVAQMGERRNGIAEVRGSIPLGSTTQPLRSRGMDDYEIA